MRLPSLLFQASCSQWLLLPLSSLFSYFSKSLNQALCVWPVLCWHERPETGHRFPSLWSIIQPDGKLEHCGTKCEVAVSLGSNYLRSKQKFISIPNKEDLVVRNDDDNINKCAFEKDPRKMPNSFVFQGWRDIKRALVQLELCLCSLFLPNNKKSFFPSQQINFSSGI